MSLEVDSFPRESKKEHSLADSLISDFETLTRDTPHKPTDLENCELVSGCCFNLLW